MQSDNKQNESEDSLNITPRLMTLMVFLILSAMPLVWLSLDQHAADKLLYLSKMAPW